MDKIVRVNMASKKILKEEVPDYLKFWGGRGFIAKLLTKEVPPGCHPFSKKNKLIFAPGLLSGTVAPCSGRLSVGAKSPLTNGIKESNAGGTVSQALSKLGIKAIIIEGEAVDGNSNLFLLEILEDNIKLIKANEYKGKGNYDMISSLIKKYGSNISTITIGPAGEKKQLVASIAISDIDKRPVRHAARGGLGAIMGSKCLKGIVIRNKKNINMIEYVDIDLFRENSRLLAKKAVKEKRHLTEYGTASLVELINEVGGLPNKNFAYGKSVQAKKVYANELLKLIKRRGGKTSHPCHPGCVIKCSNVLLDKNGELLTASLEYETIGLLGTNLCIYNLEKIASLDRVCDDYGIDTIEIGGALGVAMQAGILKFGDYKSVLRTLEEVSKNINLGVILGKGTEITGRILNVKRTPSVKGQGLAAYDPRALKGTGVTYATSPMGADHTAGSCLPGRGGYHFEDRDGLNTHEVENQISLSRDLQILAANVDCLGFCFFVSLSIEDLPIMANMIKGRFGINYTEVDLIDRAREILKTEYRFNKEAGFSNKDNKIPDFFCEEPLPPFNLIFDIQPRDLEKFEW